jgi:lysophospholipase L1-like esterase
VRLRLELSHGSLYSFRFDGDAPDKSNAPIRIVCLGDSVTRAAGVKKDQSFCALVEAKLVANGKRAVVINSGVGSDTTTGGLKRFDRDVLAHKPTHVIIMFGLNDAYRPKDKGPLVELDRYTANLKEMVKVLRSRNVVPILMTSNPFVPKNDNVAMKPYIESCRAIARAEKVALIDTYAHFAELAVEGRSGLYTDTCHLTPEGNRVVAELMLRSIEGLLQGRSPSAPAKE